jgi:hypothetical protein
VTKSEKTSDLVNRAVETFKTHPAPATINEPAALAVYYAIFDGPATWKPGVRTPQEMLPPEVKTKVRFKRSFGS